MIHGVFKLLWLKLLLSELGFLVNGPMNLYCDNKAAIGMVYNPVQHDQTKRFEVDGDFI